MVKTVAHRTLARHLMTKMPVNVHKTCMVWNIFYINTRCVKGKVVNCLTVSSN